MIEEYGIDKPFMDLPEALVEEMLFSYEQSSIKLAKSFDKILSNKERIRDALKRFNLRPDSMVIGFRTYPTACGIDGAYAIERLLATNIAGVAAVAVEGLTPPTEARHWPQPHHLCRVFTVNHHDAISLILRALMLSMEFELATNAPHDVVLLDGSLTTPLIHLNQAMGRLPDSDIPKELSTMLLDRIEVMLDEYEEILASSRSDKIYAGVPKYTSKKVITKEIGLDEYEDRALLTLLLNAGEFVGPINLVKPEEYWHFANIPENLKDKADRIVSLINQLKVIYYRPYSYIPALRVEIPPSVANNSSRIAILLESLQLQCGAPGIKEPYPLYLADRMVKHLGGALSAVIKSVTYKTLESIPQENVFLSMHGYRTDYVE